MSEVIGSVQVVVRPDTTGFAKNARKGIEDQFKRKNALELDFEVDPENVRRDVEDSRDLAQQWLDLKKNALKVNVELGWRKSDLLSQLRDFKSDVEALEKLQRPTVYANFEVDRKGLDAIREDVKLNVGLDTKVLQRAIKQATKDVTVFGDRDSIEKETRKIAQISRDAFQDIFSRRKLKLEVDADTDKLEQAQRAMEDALGRYSRSKNHLEGLEGSLAGVTSEMGKQAKLVERLSLEWEELADSGELNARQLSSYANSLREAESSLADMARHEARIRKERDHYANNIFSPSLDGADRLRREFEQLEEELDNKSVELGVVAERSSFAAVATELHALTRDRLVMVYTKMQRTGLDIMERQWRSISEHSSNLAVNATKWVGQLTGIRVLWHTFKDMVEWLPRLDMMVPQLAQHVALLGLAAAGSVGAVGVLVNLISDLAEVGKVALLIPAGLGGLTLTLYSLNMALANIADLAPKASQAMEDFDLAIAEGIWNSPGGKKTATFIEDLFNGLTSLSPRIGAALGGALGALADGIASVGSGGGLQFIENYIKGFKNAEGGLESFGRALATLGVVGSGVFGDLGTWFTEIMDTFDKWVTKNTNNGNLERWIRDSGTAMLELISIMDSTVRVFGNLSRAFKAAGFPGLTEMAAGMKSLAESTRGLEENGEFMFTLESVSRFFRTLGGVAGDSFELALENAWRMLGQSLNRLATPIAGALDAIFDGFNSSKFQTGFTTFIDGMASFLEDVSPGLQALTEDIGSLLGVVGTAGKSWGPAFNDMLLMFSSAGDKLHPGLVEFIENTGPALQQLVRDITPHVEDFAQAISDLLGDEDFQKFINDMIGSLGTLIGWLLRLGTAIVNLTRSFADWYGSLGEGGQDVVRWAGILTAAFGGVALAIGGLALKIAPGATLKLLGKGLVALAKGAGKFVADFARALAGLGMLIGRAVAALGRAIAGAFKNLKLPNPARLLAPIGKFFRGLPAALARIIPAAAGGLFRGLLPKLLKLLGGPLGWLLLLRDAVNLIKPVGVLEFVDMILDRLGFGDSWVSDLISGLAENIEEAFGADVGLFDIINPLSNMITKAWDGMVEGWDEEGLWGAIKGFFEGLGEGFVDHFQFAWENLMDLLNAFAPEGVIDFFEDPWGTIWDWLTGGGTEGEIMAPEANMLSAQLDFSPTVGPAITEGLQIGWDNLIALIKGWSPLGGFFDLLGWIGSKLSDWLSGAGELVGQAAEWTSKGIGGVIDWGAQRWGDTVKPWLDKGWETLKGRIDSWNPAGASGLGSAIDRAIGTDSGSASRTNEQLVQMGGGIATFADSVLENLGTMGSGGRREITGLADNTDAEFGRMERSGTSKTDSMSGSVVGSMLGMNLASLAQLSSLNSGSSSKFSSMRSSAVSQAGTMQAGVVAKMAAMQVRSIAEAARMSSEVVNRGRHMQAQFVAQMSTMARLAIGVVTKLRGSLTSALNINATNAGRYTGSTYVSGLSSSLSRASSVASSFQGSIRSALSFSVHSSGSAVGGSFASGLRSRISSVSAAASALAAAARRKMPNSPADEGPFSGSGWGGWGESIAEELARGMRMGAPAVALEASRMMADAATELSNTPQIEFMPDVRSIRSGLAPFDAQAPTSAGRDININVYPETRSEDPLQDGNRFGGDIAFALRGAGLA